MFFRNVQGPIECRAHHGGMAEIAVLGRGEPGYESLTSGFNLAVVHDPDVIVDAAGADDVVAAIALAVGRGCRSR